MSNYYKQRQKAFLDLNNMIASAKNKQRIDLPLAPLLITLTKHYEIGEATIIKRLKLLSTMEDFRLEEDRIVFKQDSKNKSV